MKFTVFCGGRGAGNLLKELARHTEIEVTAIINGYDDGLSTGKIRQIFNMLGPSDLRKCHHWLSDNIPDVCSLGEFFNYRFPKDGDPLNPLRSIEDLVNGSNKTSSEYTWLSNLTETQISVFRRYLGQFLKTTRTRLSETTMDFRDFSVANCVYAGAFECNGHDLNLASKAMGSVLGISNLVLTASSELRTIVGQTKSGRILWSEAEVDVAGEDHVSELWLIPTGNVPTLYEMFEKTRRTDEIVENLREFSLPSVDPTVVKEIQESDIVVIGPGTPLTSIVPTLKTLGIGKALRESNAICCYVQNLCPDSDSIAVSTKQIYDWVLGSIRSSDLGSCSEVNHVDYIILDSASAPPIQDTDQVKLVVGNLADMLDPCQHNGKLLLELIFKLYKDNTVNGNGADISFLHD